MTLSELHKLLEGKYNRCIETGKTKLENLGCEVNGIPQCSIVIHLDEEGSPLNKTNIRCDYILFISKNEGNISAYVIELKSGKSRNISVSHAKKQLQSGAEFLEDFQRANNISTRLILFPILFGKLNKSRKDKLKKERVKYYDKDISIRKCNCGDSIPI